VSGPELPIIYENPRFDRATPTLLPVINRAIRFGAVLTLAWGTLTLMEDASRYLRYGTAVIAVLILAVHESWPWLSIRGRFWYPSMMGFLIAGYAVIFGYAELTAAPHEASTIATVPTAAQDPLPDQQNLPPEKRRHPLDSDSARWAMVSRLRNALETKNATRCNLSIVRYQLPYAEKLANDLKAILKVVDWPVTEKFSQSQQPRGLSIKLSEQPNRSAERCMVVLRNAISGSTSWKGREWLVKFYYDSNQSCPECVELDIGNDPDEP
jgi:hypothetical protein